MRTAGRAILWLAFLALVAACHDPVTQLTVVVRSDLEDADLADIDVEIRPGEPFATDPSASHTFVIGASEGQVELPFSFGVTPRGGDPSAHVEIRMTVHGRTGRTTLVRTLRTGFVRGQTLALPVFLSRLCRDRAPCEPPLTCGDDGTCVSPEVLVETLHPIDPGHELDDAGMPPSDAGVDASAPDAAAPVGIPPPSTRELRTLTTSASAVTFLAPIGDEVVVGVSAPSGAAGGVLGAPGTDQPGSVVLRVARDGSVRWTRAFVASGTGRVAHGVVDGGAVYVCGEIEGTMTPQGGTPLVAPDDGTAGDRDDAAFVARLDVTTGALAWASLVTAGANVTCTDLAASGGRLAMGLAHLETGAAIALDGSAVTLDGCGSPTTAVVGIDPSGARPRARGGLGFANSAQGVLGIDGDGVGGFFATTTLFGTADQVSGGSCGSGPTVALGLVHLDASGARAWGAVPAELVGFAGLAVDVVRLDDATLRVVGATSQPSGSVAIRVGGVEVAPASPEARTFTFRSAAADGAVVAGSTVVGSGGFSFGSLVASAPDSLLCGEGPDTLYPGASFDFFGRTVPRAGATLVGVVTSLDLSGHARWLETVQGATQGYVTSCAPSGDGGAWIGAALVEAGTVFGQAESFGTFLGRVGP